MFGIFNPEHGGEKLGVDDLIREPEAWKAVVIWRGSEALG
jgi:hypothetical protein